MSICIFALYFGKLPNHFPIWLKTCENNPSFNWVIFTDDKSNIRLPHNVKVINYDLSAIKVRFESALGFSVALTKPYKLCDFKPLYGFLFKDELTNFSHWGYCDLDMLFGNISEFITEDLLNKYDKINCMGHLSILKNTCEIVNAFKLCDYKSILQNSNACTFDETNYEPNINSILINKGYLLYENFKYADIGVDRFRFRLWEYTGGKRKQKVPLRPMIFKYSNGKLFEYSVINHQVKINPCCYIHFSRRNLEITFEPLSSFIIIPNKIIELKEPITKEFIIEHSKENWEWNFNYLYHRTFKLIRKAIKIISDNFVKTLNN